MHLLFVTNLYPPHVLGGYEILCAGVVEAMRRRGHRCTVLTSTHGLTGDFAAPDDGVLRALELYAPFDRPAGLERAALRRVGLRNYERTATLIDERHPEAVFVWSQLRLTLGSAWAANDRGIPLLFTFNDPHVAGYRSAEPSWRPRSLVRFVAERLVYPRITLAGLPLDSTTCISQSLKDELLAAGVDVPSSEVIYQGIPLELFPMKEDPGRRHEPTTVLYAGQLHPYKGVHVALGAFARVAARGDRNLRFDVVGAGPAEYETRLRRQADQAGLGDRVRFAGKVPRDELAARYRGADVFVFPSIWAEPFGLTHLEAMASGLPVVSTTVGGPGEFLEDGVNALTVPADDEAALAEALEHLLASAPLRQRLALGGRRTVERKFTMTTYVDALEDFVVRHATRRRERKAA